MDDQDDSGSIDSGSNGDGSNEENEADGAPLFSFDDDAPEMPHWSEPATGEMPVIEGGSGPSRGGSRLFPQLPDDPGLIDDGPTTGVIDSAEVAGAAASPTGIDLGGSLAGGTQDPAPTGPMDDIFAATDGLDDVDADLPAPRWGAATTEPEEGFLGAIDPDALAEVQADRAGDAPDEFDGPGAEFARRGDEFMTEAMSDFDRVADEPGPVGVADEYPEIRYSAEPVMPTAAEDAAVQSFDDEPVQPSVEQPLVEQPPSERAPISVGTTPHDQTSARDLDRDDLNAWSALDDPSPVWREGAQDYETHRPADDAAERMVLHTDDESAQQAGSDASSARNMPMAVGVGVALAALFLFLLDRGPGYAMIMVVPLLVVATSEFYVSVRKVGYRPATLLGLAAVAGLPLATYWRGVEAIPLVLSIAMIFTLLWYLFGVEQDRPTANVSVTLLGMMWVGLLGSYIPLILELPHGSGILLGAIIGTVAYDVAGLFIGRATGQSRLAPNISPNKTYEGLIGGMIIAILVVTFGLGLAPGLAPWDLNQVDALLLGIVVAVVAPLGDLAQSLIKRDLDIKDMGTALPGHGGVFDRFDALLLVIPAVYYMALARDLNLLG